MLELNSKFKIDYFRHFPINVRGKVLGCGTWPEGTEQGGYYPKTKQAVDWKGGAG